MPDWSDEETDNGVEADLRNFYKVEKWTRDGMKVESLLYAGSSLDKAASYSSAPSSTGRGSG